VLDQVPLGANCAGLSFTWTPVKSGNDENVPGDTFVVQQLNREIIKPKLFITPINGSIVIVILDAPLGESDARENTNQQGCHQ
jgi:hypothetical protein